MVGDIFANLFFVAAVDVTAAAFTAVVVMIFYPSTAIFTFTSEVFLLFFGIVMCIVDFPLHCCYAEGDDFHRTHAAKTNIFRFMFFLTRFTGRGFWYLFLGSMVWAALYDQAVNKFLGLVLAIPPCLVGLVSLIYGIYLSCRVNRIRNHLKADHSTNIGCPPDGFPTTHFKSFCQHHGENFSEDQCLYIMIGLSSEYPSDLHKFRLTRKDFDAWTDNGPMALI